MSKLNVKEEVEEVIEKISELYDKSAKKHNPAQSKNNIFYKHGNVCKTYYSKYGLNFKELQETCIPKNTLPKTDLTAMIEDEIINKKSHDWIDQTEEPPQKRNKSTTDAIPITPVINQSNNTNICAVSPSPHPLVIVIAHTEHPQTMLSLEDVEEIKSFLMEKIETVENITGHGLIFCDTHDGWLTLKCSNIESKNWLMNMVTKMQTLLRSSIKMCMEDEISKRIICTIYIPYKDRTPHDRLLLRLSKQNVSLNTKDWQIVRSMIDGGGREVLTLLIDVESANAIIKRDRKLFFNFGIITVKFSNNAKINII